MYAYGVDLISSWLTGSTLGWNFFWVSMFFILGFLKSSIDVCSFPHVHFQYVFLGQNWIRKLGWSKLKWSIGDFFSWCIIFDYLFDWEVIYSSSLYFLSIIMINWLTKCKSFLFFDAPDFNESSSSKSVKTFFYWYFFCNELPQNLCESKVMIAGSYFSLFLFIYI